MTATPRTLRAAHTMTRIRQADQAERELADRRRSAVRRGYRGPLTRADLATIPVPQSAGHR